jgi:hypothetical protein
MTRPKTPPSKEWLRARSQQPLNRTAAEWGVTAPTMQMWYQRFGIPHKLMQPNPRKKPSPGREWLAARLHLTLLEMAKEAGTSGAVVRRWLDEEGLTYTAKLNTVNAEQARRVRAIATREWLAERVTVPAVEIAAELACDYGFVYRLMREAGLCYQPVRRMPTRKGVRVNPWDNHDCPTCALRALCHQLEGTLQDLPCEPVPMAVFEPDFAGRERLSA